jgi:hypothetical protein
MLNWKNLTALVCMTSGLTHAHLTAGSLLPKGGEALKVGDTFTISWGVDEVHTGGVDISLSKDNGGTWKMIKVGLPAQVKGTTIYKWTIPADAVSEQAKIRVCQPAGGPTCTDAQNNDNAGGSAPWRLVSKTFAISATTGLDPESAAGRDLSVDFNPDTRNVEVAFALAQAENVSLEAYDLRGNRQAALLQGRYAAGEHRLSVFSNKLSLASGSLVFKLRVGEDVRTHTWMTLR